MLAFSANSGSIDFAFCSLSTATQYFVLFKIGSAVYRSTVA